jgi:uncharacterized membrane protein YdjX (TVP38/TMEM64 family)
VTESDSIGPKRGRTTRFVILSVLVVVLAVLGRVLPIRGWLLSLFSALRDAGPFGVFLFILTYTPGAVFFIPSAMFTFAAGFTYGPLWGALIAIPGIALSSCIIFMLARTVLRKPVEQWLRGDPRIRAVDHLLTRFGPKAVILLRFSPLSPFNILNFAFGLTGMKPLHYFVATSIGAAPGAIFYAQLGALTPHLDELASGRIPAGGQLQTYYLGFGICLTLVVAIWLGRLAKRALAHPEEELEVPLNE